MLFSDILAILNQDIDPPALLWEDITDGSEDMAPAIQAAIDWADPGTVIEFSVKVEDPDGMTPADATNVRLIGSQITFKSGVYLMLPPGGVFLRDPAFGGIMFGQLDADALSDCGIIGGGTIDGNLQEIAISLTRNGPIVTGLMDSHDFEDGDKGAIMGVEPAIFGSEASADDISRVFARVNSAQIAYALNSDCALGRGTISGTTLTITDWMSGSFSVGDEITGNDIPSGVTIIEQLTPSNNKNGRTGTYTISTSLSISTPTIIGAAPVDYFIGATGTAFLDSSVMTVTSWTSGLFRDYYEIHSPDIEYPVFIIRQLSGTPGKEGTYEVSSPESTSSTSVTASVPTEPQVKSGWSSVKASLGFSPVRVDSEIGAAQNLKFDVRIVRYSRNHSAMSFGGVQGLDLPYLEFDNGGSNWCHGIYTNGCGHIRGGTWIARNGLGNAFKLSGNNFGYSDLTLLRAEAYNTGRGLQFADFQKVHVASIHMEDCERAVSFADEGGECRDISITGGTIVRCGYWDSGLSAKLGAVDFATKGRNILVSGVTFTDCPVGVRFHSVTQGRVGNCSFNGTDVPATLSTSGGLATLSLTSGTLALEDNVLVFISGAEESVDNGWHKLTKIGPYTYTFTGASSGVTSDAIRVARLENFRHIWVGDADEGAAVPSFTVSDCDFRTINNGAEFREIFYFAIPSTRAHVIEDNRYHPSAVDSADDWTAMVSGPSPLADITPTSRTGYRAIRRAAGLYFPPAGYKASTSTFSAVENILYLVPFTQRLVAKQLAIKVVTAATSVSVARARLGLYSGLLGTNPGELIAECDGTIDLLSQTTQFLSLPYAQEIGNTWLALLCEKNATIAAFEIHHGEANALLGLNAFPDGTQVSFLKKSQAYGDLPISVSALSTATTVTVPAIAAVTN